jgi:hypothetical protein
VNRLLTTGPFGPNYGHKHPLVRHWHVLPNRAGMDHAEKETWSREGQTAPGLNYSIRIVDTFGSEFQRTVTIRNLNKLIDTWKATSWLMS